jgi:hypothetical protein
VYITAPIVIARASVSMFAIMLTMKTEDSPTFGLIAGLGVGAGIFYYRSLVEAHLARGLSPNLVMAHADVRRVMRLAADRQPQELATYLAGLLRQLAGAARRSRRSRLSRPRFARKSWRKSLRFR